MKWKVFFASATGKYHLDGNTPCQDSGHYVVVDDVLIGVVCDGAGSAREGQAGAEFFARKVTQLLTEAVKSGAFDAGREADYRGNLAAMVERVRAELNATAQARELTLRDFACTLVGCIASRQGGCFFHIGDGFAIYMKDDGESVLSRPENGEHADETYFVTDAGWNDHLRVTSIDSINQGGLIGLMSDGTAPFAVNRPKTGFYRPFIDPVVKFLRNANEEHGSEALKNVLADEKTYEITSDDKTLLLALAS
jgi:Protein phosphatase 2C